MSTHCVPIQTNINRKLKNAHHKNVANVCSIAQVNRIINYCLLLVVVVKRKESKKKLAFCFNYPCNNFNAENSEITGRP